MGKLAIFDGNRRLSLKRCEMADSYYGTLIGSHGVSDRMVSFSMTLSDSITRVSKSLYKSNILKTVCFRDKVTKEH